MTNNNNTADNTNNASTSENKAPKSKYALKRAIKRGEIVPLTTSNARKFALVTTESKACIAYATGTVFVKTRDGKPRRFGMKLDNIIMPKGVEDITPEVFNTVKSLVIARLKEQKIQGTIMNGIESFKFTKQLPNIA